MNWSDLEVPRQWLIHDLVEQGESSKTKNLAQMQIQASRKKLYIQNTVPKIKRSTSVFEKDFPNKSFSNLSIGESSNNSNKKSITSTNVQIPIFQGTRRQNKHI